jgi:hypothetical protein
MLDLDGSSLYLAKATFLEPDRRTLDNTEGTALGPYEITVCRSHECLIRYDN